MIKQSLNSPSFFIDRKVPENLNFPGEKDLFKRCMELVCVDTIYLELMKKIVNRYKKGNQVMQPSNHAIKLERFVDNKPG